MQASIGALWMYRNLTDCGWNDGCLEDWIPANTARTENSVHVTHAVTSCSAEIDFSSNNPVFHSSSNPNRKTTGSLSGKAAKMAVVRTACF